MGLGSWWYLCRRFEDAMCGNNLTSDFDVGVMRRSGKGGSRDAYIDKVAHC